MRLHEDIGNMPLALKGDGSQSYTWGDYTNKIATMILACHVDATTICCINDPYDYMKSIKDDEQDYSSRGQGHIP